MTDNKTDETPKAAETAPKVEAAPKTGTVEAVKAAPVEAKTPAGTAPVAKTPAAKAPAAKAAPAKAAPAKAAPAKAATETKKPAATARKTAPAKATVAKATVAKPVAAKKVAAPAKAAAKATTRAEAPKKVAAAATALQPDVFAAVREGFEIVVETNRTAVETAMELQETTSSFMQGRLAASADAVDRIGHAEDLTELAGLQREYAETAFEAWSTHLAVVSTTYQDILARGVELASQRVNAASEQLRDARWF